MTLSVSLSHLQPRRKARILKTELVFMLEVKAYLGLCLPNSITIIEVVLLTKRNIITDKQSGSCGVVILCTLGSVTSVSYVRFPSRIIIFMILKDCSEFAWSLCPLVCIYYV